MTRVCLVVIYNHHFPENISKINQLYASRFSHVLHLLPFAAQESGSVHSVGRASHHFQGFIFDARQSLLAIDCDRFLFIADDLFLNPQISEKNLAKFFGLIHPEDSFLHQFDPFSSLSEYWSHAVGALDFTLRSDSLDLRHVLPNIETAMSKLLSHGAYSDRMPDAALNRSYSHKIMRRIAQTMDNIETRLRIAIRIPATRRREPATNELSYPLAYGYSDIVVISRKNMKQFADFCGAFAAAGLFVEIALPTAVALASECIRTQKDSPLGGRLLWGSETKKLDRFGKSMRSLIQDFPQDWMFVHPVKLSEWQ